MAFDFEPHNEAQRYFIKSDDKIVAFIAGIGGGKTHVGSVWVLTKIVNYPNADILIAANSYDQLHTATLKKFLDILDEAGIPYTQNKQFKTINIALSGYNGTIHYRSLNPGHYDDIRGAEFAFAWFDETRDTLKDAFDVVMGRMRQKLASRDLNVNGIKVKKGDKIPSQLNTRLLQPGDLVDQQIRITTTPDMMRGKWLYDYLHNSEMMSELAKKGIKITEVHSSSKDNPHLPPGYVESAAAGLDEEMRQQEIEGQWVIIPPGKPVFGSVFNPQIHLIDACFNKDKELLIGLDFGYHHPACIFAQVDNQDRLVVLGEILGTDRHIDEFCEDIWSYINRHFAEKEDLKVRTFCDPAGRQKSDKSEKTSFQVCIEYGLNPFCRKVGILDGITVMRRRMSKLIAGKPGLMIDKTAPCKLIEGMRGGYHYPEQTNQFTAEKVEPKKDGIYDHLMDALRYLVINLYSIHDIKRAAVTAGRNEVVDEDTGY